MSLITVKNLNFEYPKKKVLNNINFEIAEGSITALVGPNGAGKTTLLRCMASLEDPVTGHVVIDNIDVHDKPRDAHRVIGYLSDFFGVYETLTVKQCITYMAWCQKIKTDNVAKLVEELAEETDITGYLEKKAGTLSRGYKQRLGVALALVHDPKCILLDEPASGMDPEARIKFSELMLRLRERGRTVVVSSHILAELEDYCTDMLVIREGEIKSHVLLSEHQEDALVEILLSVQDPKKKHLDFIKKYEGVSECKVDKDNITISFSNDKAKQNALLADIVKKKIPLYQFSPAKKTLQTAYMDLANKKEN